MRASLLPLLTFSVAAQAAHNERTSPEWSDLALAVAAGLAIWFVRRALRNRFARQRERAPERD